MPRAATYRRATSALACSVLLAAGGLAACTYGSTAQAPPPPSPVAAAPASTVPTNLTGRTVGEAKAALARAGFTNVVVAGGEGITDADAVTAAPEQGAHLAPTAAVRLIAAPPATPSTSRSDSGTTSSERGTSEPTSPHRTKSGSSGSSSTCDLSGTPEFGDPAHPNEITNRDCGYSDSRGNARNHDPWIDDQLQQAREQSAQPPASSSTSGGPGSENARQHQQCLHTSGCDPNKGN